MKRPSKAIVLAAGFGTRLHPFTLDCPKALVPLKGKPMLAHTLERLASWGVTEVAINVHTLADRIVEALPELSPKGMSTVLSFEPELLGTGGGLRRLEWFFGDEPLWVCNADIWADLSPEPLISAFKKANPLACLWLVPERGPKTVKTSSQGHITTFRGKNGTTFSGLHLVSPRMLDFLPEEELFCSVIPAYEKAMSKGEQVLGVELPGSEWADIGTPDELLKAEGGSVVFPGAEIGPGICLENAIVGTGARLTGKKTVSGRIVSPEHGLSKEEQERFPKVGSVERLSFRGSDRSYRRLYMPKRSVILSVSGEERPENFRVAHHTRILKRNGIRVPEVLQSRKKGRVVVLEDVGGTHLLDRVKQGSRSRTLSDMKKVIELVAQLHRIHPPKELEPPFSSTLVKWERSLFLESFLNHFDPEADQNVLMNAFARVGRRFLKQPQVLVHRDLQSTNLMWHKGKPVLIDFQGMRRGPASYDLGSLFADPYVNRSRDEQEALLSYYNDVADSPVTLEAYRVGAVQRLCQALGAYGRLGSNPDTKEFLKHIPAGLHQLSLWSDDPVLNAWANDFSRRHSEMNGV